LVIKVVLLALVLTAAFYDLRWRRIPNWLVLAGVLLGFGLNGFLSGAPLRGLLQALLGFGLASLVYFPLYVIRAMGAGDVKLMMAVGSLVGWRAWLLIFVLTAVVGGITALIVILLRGRVRQTAGNVVLLLMNLAHLQAPHSAAEQLDVRSSKGLRLPHGAAIALGTIAFLAVGYFIGQS
jgi:prepilin peptidase CpaA